MAISYYIIIDAALLLFRFLWFKFHVLRANTVRFNGGAKSIFSVKVNARRDLVIARRHTHIHTTHKYTGTRTQLNEYAAPEQIWNINCCAAVYIYIYTYIAFISFIPFWISSSNYIKLKLCLFVCLFVLSRRPSGWWHSKFCTSTFLNKR